MKLDGRRWLATLRARRYVVLFALLPAFALSAAAAPACAAMAPASQQNAPLHEHGDARLGHYGSDQTTHETKPLSPACSHCPFDSGEANVGHAGCEISDAQKSDVAYAKIGVWKAPPPVIMDSRLPAASMAPPLIAFAPIQIAPLSLTVPLTLRHCVLQI